MTTIIKSYILSVAVTAVISSVISMLSPAKWSKYVSMVTGLAVVICLTRPLLSVLEADVFKNTQLNVNEYKTQGSDILASQIKTELEKRIEDDINKRLKTEFSLDVTATAEVRVNQSSQVEAVEKITVYGDRPQPEVIGRIREIYGAGEIIYGGTEKNIKKTE